MNLDATAGNRLLWPCKNPPEFIFMDRETELKVSPDIFCAWEHLPFRDNVFHTIIFDPPHLITKNGPTYYKNPENAGGPKGTFYGWYVSKIDLIKRLTRAAKEFYRVGKVVSMKWYEGSMVLEKVIPLMRPWVNFKIFKPRPRMGRRAWRKSSSNTWWVTFVK
jgi:hypothetical protein